jgi:flagellar motor switch protein FliN/FliY
MRVTDPTDWLMSAISRQLTQSASSMAGSEIPVQWRHDVGEQIPDAAFGLAKSLSVGAGAPIWIGAGEPAWRLLGETALSAAGVENPSENDVRETFLEILSQAIGGLASELTSVLKAEVTADGPAEAPNTGAPANRLRLVAAAGGAEHSLFITLSQQLIEAISGALQEDSQSPPQASTPAVPATADEASKFDLLLDVELPVSVSFGRSQLALKDVLNLATGSIVELNRSVTEPVEIIVNNCVIARGEVVVVAGNYGVRVRQIVSRNERLRTLH